MVHADSMCDTAASGYNGNEEVRDYEEDPKLSLLMEGYVIALSCTVWGKTKCAQMYALLCTKSKLSLQVNGVCMCAVDHVLVHAQKINSCMRPTHCVASCYRACSFTLLFAQLFISLSPTLTSFVLYPFLFICLFPFFLCFPLTHLCLLCFPLTHSLYLSILTTVT